MAFKVRVKLPSCPTTAGGGEGGSDVSLPRDGGGPGGEGPPPPPDPPPSAPVPLASAPTAAAPLAPSDVSAAHIASLATPALLSPPPADHQARWAAVLAGVRGLAAAAADGCLGAVAASLVGRAYGRGQAGAPAAAAPPAPDRVLLDDVLAVAVVTLPPATLRDGLVRPLAEGVGAGRVAYGRRAPPFHALVSACGGGGGDDGRDSDDEEEEEEEETRAGKATLDGPAAVLAAIAAAAADPATPAGGRAALAAWAADTLVACPDGPVRARRVAGLVAASPEFAAAAVARHADALASPAAWAALSAPGGGPQGHYPDLAPCVAGLASSGRPADVRTGVRAALRGGGADPARAAAFVAAVCGGGGGGGGTWTGGGGAGPDALSARVGAAAGALADAARGDPSTPAHSTLASLLSRPGLEGALDPADAVRGLLDGRQQEAAAAITAAWAAAAAAWLTSAAGEADPQTALASATARADWLVQCAAVAGGSGASAAAAFTPVLAAGLGAAGAGLPLPAATALGASLLGRVPVTPAHLAVRAVRALAAGAAGHAGADPSAAASLLGGAGAAALRAAAAGVLVDGRAHDSLLEAARSVMEGQAPPGVARAVAVLEGGGGGC